MAIKGPGAEGEVACIFLRRSRLGVLKLALDLIRIV